MITDLPVLIRERVDYLRQHHRPAARNWWERLTRQREWCVMCGQWWICQDRRWAEDVAAGRRAGWSP